jgi:acyl-CoA synthetase (NDP forming)
MPATPGWLESSESDLGLLFAPATVALVGASDDPLKFGGVAGRNLLASNIKRTFFVNAARPVVLGQQTYPDMREIPEVPDLVVLAVSASAALTELAKAANRGVRAAVVFASGFAETGSTGRALQVRLSEIANDNGMIVLGPNCVGLVNSAVPCNLSSVELPNQAESVDVDRAVAGIATTSNIAVVSQSGSLGIAVVASLRQTARYLVSTGNEAVITAAHVVEYLLAIDPQVRTIGLVLESVRDAEALARAAALAKRAGVSVILLKLGVAPKGQELAALHTGSLGGAADALAAFCRLHGIRLADSLRTFRAALLLSELGYKGQAGMGVFTTSGGSAVLSADYADRKAVRLTNIAPLTAAAVSGALDVAPESVTNPFDTKGTFAFNADRFSRALDAFASDPDVGLVLVPLGGAGGPAASERATAMARLIEAAPVPLVPVWQRGAAPNDPAFRTLLEEGMAQFSEFETVIDAMALLSQGEERGRRAEAVRPIASTKGPGSSRRAPRQMPLGEAFDLFRSAGVPVVPFSRVRTGQRAIEVATNFGWPVALKVDHPEALHKTDKGLVFYPIHTRGAVESAFRSLRSQAQALGFADHEVLVQAGRPGGQELIVSVLRDSQVGPFLVLGAGGILTELLNSSLAMSLTGGVGARALTTQILGTLQRLDVYPLLRGYRGARRFDINAAARAIAGICRAFLMNPQFEAVEVNPLVVLPKGEGAWVVDVAITTSESTVAK